ncbi:MAG: prolyl 4-hydroxylase [Nitrospirales bacterium]|nr:MAG: prolyl 4-hydroxylase [Nitrospirales bacterium]
MTIPHNLDWEITEQMFQSFGYVQVPKVLDQRACLDLIHYYRDDRNFRKRIVMDRHNFGVGDYAYFAEPLPPLIAQLRTELYRGLVPMANHLMEAMRQEHRYPNMLTQFLAQCHEQGQTQPTLLILHYETGGMNRLHRDVYGPTVFPFQVMVMLSQKGRDFEGGEFVLVEHRPRQQSLATVLTPDQGDLVIFPVCERPIEGKRGMLRAGIRHGVSRIHSGERWVLGVIFHDAL